MVGLKEPTKNIKTGIHTERIFIGERQKEDVQIIPKFIEGISSLFSNTEPIKKCTYILGEEEEGTQLQYFISPTFTASVLVWLQTNLFVFYLTSFTKELPVRKINDLVIDYFKTNKFEYTTVIKEL